MRSNGPSACRVAKTAALSALFGLLPLQSNAGERTSGTVAITSESVNSSGISFSSSGAISFGSTLGQPISTKPQHSGDKAVLPGFWNRVAEGRAPAPTLFMFR